MRQTMKTLARMVLAIASTCGAACHSAASDCGPPPGATSSPGDAVSLRDRLAARRLRSLNRQVSLLNGSDAVRVNAAAGVGLIWIEGTDIADGVIEADVCGREVQSESFVGLAFHRRNDDTYEAVYLRPFNFRSSSAEHQRHAV